MRILYFLSVINFLHSVIFVTPITAGNSIVTWRAIHEDLTEYRLIKSSLAEDSFQCVRQASEGTQAVWYSSLNQSCQQFVCNRGTNGCRKCRHAAADLVDNVIKQVWVRAQPSGQVRCWKTFQHRVSSNLSFYRNWSQYARGFGDDEADNFWLGLDTLHQLTADGGRRVRWELSDWDGKWYWTESLNFSVAGAPDKFRASIGNMDSGSSSIGQAFKVSNVGIQGNRFSTPESDNDNSPANCASERHGGWWFGYCGYFNPNGLYRYPPEALHVSSPPVPMSYTCSGCPSPITGSYSLQTIECLIEYDMA